MAQDWGARSPKEDFSTRVRGRISPVRVALWGGSVDYYSSPLGLSADFYLSLRNWSKKSSVSISRENTRSTSLRRLQQPCSWHWVCSVHDRFPSGLGCRMATSYTPQSWAGTQWMHTSILRFTVGVVTRKDEWIAAASGLRPIPSRGAPVRLVGRSVRNEAGSSTFTGNTGQVDTHVQHAPLFSNSV
jgi:hypothetical protein